MKRGVGKSVHQWLSGAPQGLVSPCVFEKELWYADVSPGYGICMKVAGQIQGCCNCFLGKQQLVNSSPL